MFYKETNEYELGETTIPNVFIDMFMPSADGLYVKVYIMGYRRACDKTESFDFTNKSIARNLNVTLDQVMDAWSYWEGEKIVKVHIDENVDRENWPIEFIDIDRFYFNSMLACNTSGNSLNAAKISSNPNTSSEDNLNIHAQAISSRRNSQDNYIDLSQNADCEEVKLKPSTHNLSKSKTDKLIEVSQNPLIRNMFNTINKILGRPLVPYEKETLIEAMEKYNMDTELIVFAYENVKEKTGFSKPVRYIESILRSWYDSNYFSIAEIQESEEFRKDRYLMYKQVFNQLGFIKRLPSKSEQQVMDVWFDEYEMDMELIFIACDKTKNIPNPSISYVNGIIKRWSEDGVRTLDALAKYEEEYLANKKKQTEESKDAKQNYYKAKNLDKQAPKKNKFHNFNETFTQYSPEEFDEIVKKSQKAKFNK
ncbi:MAG: DnaD domain protein [Clostridioides sp.]|jgi:DnaD/phage-associated family protein|nr:DnaD domain protein [Clostridioides sp.]